MVALQAVEQLLGVDCESENGTMYRCWNSNCPNYAGYGVQLGHHGVICDTAGYVYCRVCGTVVEHVPPATNQAGTKAALGTGGGVLLGLALGGPPGAIVGGVIGLLLGLRAGQER